MPETATHITTSGGLISAAFIDNIREPRTRQPGTEPESFAMPGRPPTPSPSALEDEIGAAYELMLERWDAIHDEIRMFDVSQVRSRWLLPLFQVLDFDPVYVRGDVVLDEAGKLRYPLSHRGWDVDSARHPELAEGPYLHTVIPSQKLDERQGSGRGIKSKSPHDMLQAFLNNSSDYLWAVLSNGILLRLLRDYHHTFTKGYVQFDLEAMFETRNYGDFRALYRMCHASRFTSPPPAGGTEGGLCPLEQFYKDSIATGVKVGEDLRGQVRQAIETLGNGFLAASPELIRQLQSSPLSSGGTEGGPALCQQYYGDILRVVYRILFLLFAEQRGMMPGRDSLYAETYSVAALRGRAEGDIPRRDDFTDLWEGLKVTFEMVRKGAPALDVFGYDGMLFAKHQTPLLDGRSLRNSDLLHAIRDLTLIQREGVLQRISYADLGVEELGSIYESLLDFTPRVTQDTEMVEDREIPPHTFFLDPRGSERKTTGSYYTHDSLVNELIKSALLPVARDRLAEAGLAVIEEDEIGEATAGLLTDYAGLTDAQRQAGEQALLSLKVCDPAVGSGHFVVKANDVLGGELARVRTGDEYPTEAEIQAAKRDVLAHCIYAVDVNPMAVELCKVSLWINASVRDRPLSFLDHHIKCGNSLIGTTPELMAEGVPYEAFDHTLEGNDRERAKAIRKRNRQERRDMEAGGGFQPSLLRVTVFEPDGQVWQYYHYATDLALEKPQVARERYEQYQTASEVRRRKLVADAWTSAFFWPIEEDTEWAPTYGEFIRLRDEGPEALSPQDLDQIEELADQYRFFHWHLEFPDVFDDKASGGFDVIMGNVPWEMLQLDSREFFASRAPEISEISRSSARSKAIDSLAEASPDLYQDYVEAQHASDCKKNFVHTSGRFPLSSYGRINLAPLFAETASHLISDTGRAGLMVPTGIATDSFNQFFFSHLVETGMLSSLYDFENREGLFPDVHRSYKFCLLTLRGEQVAEDLEADFVFFARHPDHITDENRQFKLGPDDFQRINPNTHTCPVFRTRAGAELTRKIYKQVPVLKDEQDEKNPWNIRFQLMFMMNTDSHLFHTKGELDEGGFRLEGNHYVDGNDVYLPLYEAKMFWHFDHRFGSFAGTESRSDTHLAGPSNAQYADPTYLPEPWYWVKQEEVAERESPPDKWSMAFRNITNTTNARTAIFSLLPRSAVGNSAPLLMAEPDSVTAMCGLLANLNALAFDYVVRRKMGGTNLNFYIVKQLPVLPPDHYTSGLVDFVVPRVVELTYTAWDLQPFAQDVLDEVGEEMWARWFADAPVHTSPAPDWAPGSTPPPFVWDEERRARLRAELDALYGHLYGLTREELAYTLDTFPIVKRKNQAKYGEYRTKRMILEKYGEVEPLMR